MNIVGEAHNILKQNRRVTDGHQYTQPSSESYPYQWLWDSCFHAIVLARLEPEAAKEELRSLVSRQFPDGMIPHMIYWQPGDLHKYEWGKEGTSAITQPPMLAYAVWEIYKRDNDTRYLEELFHPTFQFFRYLIEERDPRDHHLVGIINPDESGEDNSPRFDSALGVPPGISLDEHLKRRLVLIEKNKTCDFDAEMCMKRFFWVKDVPFQAILIENLRCLEHIASRLGEEEAEHYCKTHIDLISKSMREHLFEEGVFWSARVHEGEYEKIKVATWAHFAPLFADLYSKEEAEALVRNHLLNEETFLSPFGIRTVSKEEDSYDPEGFWRGPVWMAPHWFIYRGLMKYGFRNEADMIRDKSLGRLKEEGFREQYHPETGKGLGANNFTWGALIVDMIEE